MSCRSLPGNGCGRTIAAYRLMGMERIVSLLTHDEAEELGLSAEAAFCRDERMAFLQFAIPDRGLADGRDFAALARQVYEQIIAGTTVGIHCRGGIGRSGMLACCILMLHGLTADEALACVSHARGVTVPDTDAQAAFIRAFGG
jgi:protein-tyrosine phosphatase